MAHTICSQKMVNAFQKFNADLDKFLKDSDNSPLYEDAFTSRQVRNFHLSLAGTLTWEEEDRTARYSVLPTGYKTERETMFDDDEAREFLKFWRACLRRAKRYWSMDTETLDAIQESEKEDIEIEED